MKNYLRWGIGVVLLVFIGVISASGNWNWVKSSAPSKALNVNSVVADPGAYQGEIKVRGVVARTSPDAALFALIDVREYRSCGRLSCASKFVAVHYAGSGLPKIKTEVVVAGEMVSSGQGYLLQAETVQLLDQ